MSKSNTVIRFAVMLDSYVLKNWQILSIKKIIEDPLNELVLFIKNENLETYNSAKLPIGFRYLERQLRKEQLFQSCNIEEIFTTIPKVVCKPEKRKGANYISESDLSVIKKYELDFILRFGFGIIKGDVLDLPTYGIWSFHHGNPRKFRGGPPSFWEFIQGQKTNGIILQRLNSELDAGEIIREGNIAIWRHSFNQHSTRLFEYGIDFPNWVCNSIRSNNGKLKTSPIKEKGTIYKVPSNLKLILFYWKLFLGKLLFHYIQLFQGEIWNMGVANKIEEIEGRKEIKNISWAPEGNSNTYKADPFWGEQDKVYFENYDYQHLKGDINSIEFKNGKWSNEQVFRQDNTHYSYPFYMEENGKSFLLPENFQGKELKLHEVTAGIIVSSRIILKGDWIDPTLIKHLSKWWLFVTPQINSNEALYLFYSDRLDGEYLAHPLNPIKIDICSARPGGTPFLDKENRLIRPAQNSAKTYGGSIVLNEIVELNENNYSERKIDEIFPDSTSKYKQALHTFTYKGDQILIDGKRVTFIFDSFWSQLKRKTKRVFKS